MSTAGATPAGCFPPAAAPGAGDFASGRDLEWCQVHQARHMAPGYGDPEASPSAGWTPPHFNGDPRIAGADACPEWPNCPGPACPVGATCPAMLAQLDAPRVRQSPAPYRLALTDPAGREVLVMTYRDGHVCTSYDEQDLDAAARAILAEVIGIAVDPAGAAPDVRDGFGAHTFTCAYEAEPCGVEVTTVGGAVGPWHQLRELGWRRNAGGAWQCPTHSAKEA